MPRRPDTAARFITPNLCDVEATGAGVSLARAAVPINTRTSGFKRGRPSKRPAGSARTGAGPAVAAQHGLGPNQEQVPAGGGAGSQPAPTSRDLAERGADSGPYGSCGTATATPCKGCSTRPAVFAPADRLVHLPLIHSFLVRRGDTVLGAAGVSAALPD